MDKIKELKGNGGGRELADKINELVQAVNNLKCQEDAEQPIFELLHPHDILIISQNDEGLLIATNDGWGKMQMVRVKYPEEAV